MRRRLLNQEEAEAILDRIARNYGVTMPYTLRFTDDEMALTPEGEEYGGYGRTVGNTLGVTIWID